MSWNNQLRSVWFQCKHCTTLDDFLSALPVLEEHNIVSWQRTFTIDSWERTCCDFLWTCHQHKRGNIEWSKIMLLSWPTIQTIIQEKNIEEAFALLTL